MDYPHSVPGVSLLDGRFTDGNPLLGVPASLDPASWANAVTDEILAVVVAGGLLPDEGDNTQLAQAIAAIVEAAIPDAPADASEMVKGVVELATAAEVIAGTDTVRAVTAAALAALTATEARRGLVELASNAETQTGTDSARAVTPAGLESARPSKACCTAWVNFNGTGTVAIRDSHNVSSVTDLGAGSYTVIFAAPMDRDDYVISCPANGSANGTWPIFIPNFSGSAYVAQTINGFRVWTGSSSGGVMDFSQVQASVHGGKN